MFEVIDVQS